MGCKFQVWGALAVLLAWMVATVILILRFNPDLLAERLGPRKGDKPWATASNTFFSRIVHIQSERGHAVVTGGPYHYVRHPGYAGAILYELAVPILFASWWSLIPSGLDAILMILRTAFEDHTLQAELPGYIDYSRQVRYRLLPGIW
jgi:protein-S-isoprenylcysteine O-methyltransferase Ste14